jgi:hypothetical protein
VDEQQFWRRLEFRVCAELAGFADRRQRRYWCDGLLPDDYDLAGAEPRISGTAYCGPGGQERWRFILLIGRPAASAAGIDWPGLLPAGRLTGWLTPDPRQRTLRINPKAGYDDGHRESERLKRRHGAG